MLLAYFTAGSCLFLDIVYNQPRKLLCPFFECALVYTTTGMGRWCLCTNNTKSKALSVKESFKHYSKLTSLFPSLLMWYSAFENSWGLHFSVYTSILFLSIGRMTAFLNIDHLNMLAACLRLLPVQWMFLPGQENAVPIHENLFAYRLLRLRRVPVLSILIVIFFFKCIFTQIRCLSVSLNSVWVLRDF